MIATHNSASTVVLVLSLVLSNPATAQNESDLRQQPLANPPTESEGITVDDRTGAPAGAHDHAVGLKVGLLGLGLDYGHRISELLAIRVGVNGSGVSFDETESGIEYGFDLDFDSIALALDVHPFRGPFRLSFGILKNDSSISAVGIGTGTYTIGDTVYTASEVGTLRGRVGFEGTAPFASFGWDLRQNRRVGLALDFGVVDQGAPRVALSANGLLATNPEFQSNLEAEQAELQASLDDLDLYPYAAFGFVCRF